MKIIKFLTIGYFSLILAASAAADSQGFRVTPTSRATDRLAREYQVNDSLSLAAKVRGVDRTLSILLTAAWGEFVEVHDYVYTSPAEKWRSVSQHSGRIEELSRAQHGQIVPADEKALMLQRSFSRLVSLRKDALLLLAQRPGLGARINRCIQNLMFGPERRADHE